MDSLNQVFEEQSTSVYWPNEEWDIQQLNDWLKINLKNNPETTDIWLSLY